MKNCPFCGRKSALLFRAKDFNRRLSQETFDYYRCGICKLIFLSPIPSDLGLYYPADYYRLPASLDEALPSINAQRFKLDIVQKFVTEGRLLEIGPGCGEFAYLAKQAGFEVDTIEMDEKCCHFIREKLEVRAINSDDVIAALESSPIATVPRYDVIALWHVIEHLPNPWSVLESVTSRLAPGGILVIAAPNPRSFQFRFFRRFWPHLDAPRHLLLIPTRLLIQKARRLGLKTAFITTNDPGALQCNQFGWNQGLSNFISHPKLKPRARGLGNRVSNLLKPIETGGLRGSTYTIVFKNTQQSPSEPIN